jgi:hypothetical protein
MTRTYRWSGLALIALLAGCEPSELRPVPAFGGGSSGESYSSPVPPAQTPLAPPQAHIHPERVNIPGQQEVHGAVSESACYDMAHQFRKDGRTLRLKEVRFVGGTELPYVCIFEGEDAESGYFDDRRYDTPRH